MNRLTDIFAVGKFDYGVMVPYQNLTGGNLNSSRPPPWARVRCTPWTPSRRPWLRCASTHLRLRLARCKLQNPLWILGVKSGGWIEFEFWIWIWIRSQVIDEFEFEFDFCKVNEFEFEFWFFKVNEFEFSVFEVNEFEFEFNFFKVNEFEFEFKN